MRIALMLDPAEGMSGIPGRASEMDTSRCSICFVWDSSSGAGCR
jgi:hypothetical protein